MTSLAGNTCGLGATRSASHHAASFSGRPPSTSATFHAQRSLQGSRSLCVAQSGFGRPPPQERVHKARDKQLSATELLSNLIQAPDTRAIAASQVDSITEEFFLMASTYLDMAQKEKNQEVVSQLEQVMKICMEEKQKTLRPEIQLLNTLLATQSADARKQIIHTPDSVATMMMNNQYFDSLLNRMVTDVDRQPAGTGKPGLLEQLKDIQMQAAAAKQQASG